MHSDCNVMTLQKSLLNKRDFAMGLSVPGHQATAGLYLQGFTFLTTILWNQTQRRSSLPGSQPPAQKQDQLIDRDRTRDTV